MRFFESIGNWIDSFFDFLVANSKTEVVEVLTSLVGITITLQIMFKAYQSFAGKTNEPLRELIWDITIKMLVVGVALNLNGYLDTIKIGMENLQNIMSGNTNLYSALDDKYDETIKLITVISEKYSFWDSGSSVAGTVLAIILVFLGFLLGIIPSFLIVVITGTTLKILMLLAPIVIYSWIYPWFRNVFTQWLQIFITNLLTVFVVGLMLSQFSQKYGDHIAKAQTGVINDYDVLSIGFQSLVMGILLFGLIKIAVEIADKIGTVSIERLVQSGVTGSQSAPSQYKQSAGNIKQAVEQFKDYRQSKVAKIT